eukprot:scaffold44556_cov22-Tisochrysis_lutea.AAC.1
MAAIAAEGVPHAEAQSMLDGSMGTELLPVASSATLLQVRCFGWHSWHRVRELAAEHRAAPTNGKICKTAATCWEVVLCEEEVGACSAHPPDAHKQGAACILEASWLEVLDWVLIFEKEDIP